MADCPSYARPGAYIGTTVGAEWWRRYRRDGFLARGNGRYWLNEEGFHFLRALTRRPIIVPCSAVTATSASAWHAGRWGGGVPILRIHWRKDDLTLISGFVVSRDADTLERLAAEIMAFAQAS
jgi:hypothetical protein